MQVTSTILDRENPSYRLLAAQASHVLFVLCNSRTGADEDVASWLGTLHSESISNATGIVLARHFRLHPIDITRGRRERLPFQFLSIYELSLDGAEQAASVIQDLNEACREGGVADEPAFWLTFPACEKIGRSNPHAAMVTIAFANSVPGKEANFREFYTTRHIRHALNIPAFVSAQCFERSSFQAEGAMPAKFGMLTVYEQVGGPEDILNAFDTIPQETFFFPTLDTSRFSESVYERIA